MTLHMRVGEISNRLTAVFVRIPCELVDRLRLIVARGSVFGVSILSNTTSASSVSFDLRVTSFDHRCALLQLVVACVFH